MLTLLWNVWENSSKYFSIPSFMIWKTNWNQPLPPCNSPELPAWISLHLSNPLWWETSKITQHWSCAQLISHVQLFATPWTVAHQAPLSIGILQARILEWVAIPSFKGWIFPTKGQNWSLLHDRRIIYHLSHQGTPPCWSTFQVTTQLKKKKKFTHLSPVKWRVIYCTSVIPTLCLAVFIFHPS